VTGLAAAEDGYVSPPVQRAARLLRAIAAGDAVDNMTRTAQALGINRTTLLRLLRTLEAEGFLEAREGGGYRLGLGLVGMAAEALAARDPVQAAGPVAQRLAEELGLSAHLGQLDGREVVYLVRRTPNLSFVSNIRVGSRLPAHAANMGRIILAHLPREEVARRFAGCALAPVTPQTPTSLEALQTRLAADRAAGLAWSDGFYEAGISSVAAAVFDITGQPVAALNVTGQSASFQGEERRRRIGQAVAAAAEEISQRLGWPGRARRSREKVA
jgi:DNA-binding IclR family transcriptional regulator